MTSVLAGWMTMLSLFLDDLHLVVGLDDALATAFSRSELDRREHVLLLVDDRFAQQLRPVEIVAHHLDDLGIVQKRNDAAVPRLLRLQILLGLALVEEALGFDDLQGIERGRGDDGDQFVRIERDPRDEHFHLLGTEGCRLLVHRFGADRRRLGLGMAGCRHAASGQQCSCEQGRHHGFHCRHLCNSQFNTFGELACWPSCLSLPVIEEVPPEPVPSGLTCHLSILWR